MDRFCINTQVSQGKNEPFGWPCLVRKAVGNDQAESRINDIKMVVGGEIPEYLCACLKPLNQTIQAISIDKNSLKTDRENN